MNILTHTIALFIKLLILAGDQDSQKTVTSDESRSSLNSSARVPCLYRLATDFEVHRGKTSNGKM
jgi:hypothetical protein